MPADVCDLDRVYAERACQTQWEHALVHVSRQNCIRRGGKLTMFSPTFEAAEAVARIFAEFREIYLGPKREQNRIDISREEAQAIAQTPADTEPGTSSPFSRDELS